jgi:signal transduction histidine kinase
MTRDPEQSGGLTGERERLAAELARTKAELDQLSSVAAHELKSPLRGIASLTDSLEEDLGDRLGDGGRELLGRLRGRLYRLEALLDGLLTYAAAGRDHHPTELVPVAELVHRIATRLDPSGSAFLEIARDLPILVTERRPLEQVFSQLIDNALKHAGHAAPRITVNGRQADGIWQFSVIDDGVGIEPAFHQRVWRPFETLRPRDRVEGAGIGLALVRKIVERRGGQVALASRPRRGATLHFTWPPIPPSR